MLAPLILMPIDRPAQLQRWVISDRVTRPQRKYFEIKSSQLRNLFVGGVGLSGRIDYALALAAVTTVALIAEYGALPVQWFGIALLVGAFLKMSGLLPFWPI